MADIIQLLPDSIANQIAAGEVIQRPASVVKELLENAIDAGATSIQVILKDAGKALIQIIDNGCGMSETDARMSFERHATSKIRDAKDLFCIKTMGFRGEALASIAAVAQVEMRTRQHIHDLGTRIVIEGSAVKTQEPCQAPSGTTFFIKNLFYNIPARRNFLKSDSVEMRHILDEFQRIAIANPEVHFTLHHNNNELFHLPAGNLRQRLVSIFGAQSNKKLVPVSEETDVVRINGFVGKPEFAKKTRGEQFFFVNNRFIKSAYLHHAIMSAFENLLPDDAYPMYVLFIDIDPSRIDINVHPTKQEIKFDDERLVYHYLRVSVRHALGQYAVMPSLDFDTEPTFTGYETAAGRQNKETKPAADNRSEKSDWGRITPPQNFAAPNTSSNLQNWKKLYEGLDENDESAPESTQASITIESAATETETESATEQGTFGGSQKLPYQIHNTYIVSHIKSGYLLIDQQAAHERILYERYLELFEKKEAGTQQELFPRTLRVSPADAEVLREMLPQINMLGFDIQDFGADTFVIHGTPADVFAGDDSQKTIEKLLEQFKSNLELKLDLRDNIARSLARSAAIKRGKVLTVLEMQELIDKLFACQMPFKNPTGRNCFITFDLDELRRKFESG